MYTNTDITIYADTENGYERKYIYGVFWEGEKASNLLKSGMTVSDAVTLYIPKSSIPDGFKVREGKDLIVKGICPLEFNNTDGETISKSLKNLRKDYRVIAVSVVDEKYYGSETMQHIQLSCK